MIPTRFQRLSISKSIWCTTSESLIAWANENDNLNYSNMRFLSFLRMQKEMKNAKSCWTRYSQGIGSTLKSELKKTELQHKSDNLNNEKIESSSLMNNFILELTENSKKNKLSHKFSEQMMDISWILFLTSPKCYKIIRQLIPLPCKSILYQKFSSQLVEIKKQLTSLDGMTNILSEFYELSKELHSNSGRKKVISTLFIDAFSFRSYLGMVPTQHSTIKINYSNKQILNNGFIFMIAPLNSKIPTKIFHIETRPNGSYNKEISDLTKEIMTKLENSGFRIWFKATDGDTGLHCEHKLFFEKFILNYSYTCFSSLINYVMNQLEKNEDMYIPISDPLHIFKNIRARIIQHRIAVTLKNDKEPAIVEINMLRKISSLDKVLNDESQIGKMRDSYALKLFTFKNIMKLLDAQYYQAVLLFFPFFCWISTIFSPNLSLELRVFFVELSFQIFFKLLQDIDSLLKIGVCQRGKGNAAVFTEELYVVRIINTLVAFGITLIFGEDTIRMDSLGTHLVENAIGIARQDTSDPRWTRILTSFAHAEMRKRLARKHGIKLHVQGRLNDGGCKISMLPEELAAKKHPDWRVETFVELLFGCCKDDLVDTFKEPLRRLIEQVHQTVGDVDVREYSINETANALIMARLISFKSE